MANDKTKQHLQEIRSKEREAREDVKALQDRQSSIDADVSRAYENYVQKQVDQQVGECTGKDVSKAEKRYLSLRQERDDLNDKIAIAERLQSTFKDKVIDAESDFRNDAVPFHKEKLKPHFENIQDALDTINSEIENINSYRRELMLDKVGDSVLKGITRNSKALISTSQTGSLTFKNFIQTINK